MPKVSIVIPTYNRGKLIERTIQSIFAQTYEDYEIIVVDDGSTDDTKHRIKQYGDRVRYIYQKNRGVSAARNKGIKQANGQYIAFCDSDDMFLPPKLEKQMRYAENNPTCKFQYTWYYKVYDHNKGYNKIRGNRTCNDLECFRYCLLTRSIEVRTSTVMVDKECFQKTGVFNEKYWKTEDWDMWLRLAEHYLGACIEEPLTVCVRHNQNISRNTGINFRETVMRNAMKAYGWDNVMVEGLREKFT